MVKSFRPLPENLRGIIELQKSTAESHLAKIDHGAEALILKSKSLPREMAEYLKSFKKAVELFREAPTGAYMDIERRDRLKFSKEISHLAGEPVHNFKHIVESMKVLNELLEKMLFKSKFFGHEIEHHAHREFPHAPHKK